MEESWTGKHTGYGNDHIHAAGIKNVLLQRSASFTKDDALETTAEYHRLLVDLQKTVSRRDGVIQNLQSKQNQLSKRCRIQRKLIEHLRQQLHEAQEFQAAPTLRPDVVASGSDRAEQRRVVSLDGALQRIRGVEVPVPEALPVDDVPGRAGLEEIDLEEFQPISDFQAETGFAARIIGLTIRVADLVGRVSVILQEKGAALMSVVRSIPWQSYKLIAFDFGRQCLTQLRARFGAIKAYQHEISSNYLQKTK